MYGFIYTVFISCRNARVILSMGRAWSVAGDRQMVGVASRLWLKLINWSHLRGQGRAGCASSASTASTVCVTHYYTYSIQYTY